MKIIPTPNRLNETLRYEPDLGKLFWLPRIQRNGSVFRLAGKEAFTAFTANGYKQGAVDGHNLYAHRVIVAMSIGEWPEAVDHINGDRADNRIINLRAVTSAENAKNRRLLDANTSGHVGVYRHSQVSKWVAYIHANGQCKSLGCFDNFADAVAARQRASEEYGFHANHGRAA